jgi:hypothetical protein
LAASRCHFCGFVESRPNWVGAKVRCCALIGKELKRTPLVVDRGKGRERVSCEGSFEILHYDEVVKKWLKRLGGVVVLALIALQFTNPSHENPAVLPGHDVFAANSAPPKVAAILRNSCYDCHSFETKWPWYSYVAPVSWYVAHDVKAARSSLNFSDWPHDDAGRARKRWRRIADAVESDEMPLANFTRMHPQARLDEQQRAELVKWAREQADSGK